MAIYRITHSPAVMGGKPCIRGLRVTAGIKRGHSSLFTDPTSPKIKMKSSSPLMRRSNSNRRRHQAPGGRPVAAPHGRVPEVR
jgi:hypothetical protein